MTASRPRTIRKPKICTVFHGQASFGSASITPRNIIGYARRQARTGLRYATATGSTEPAASSQATAAGSARLPVRYSPAARPSPIRASRAIGTAQARNRPRDAGREASRSQTSRRNGPVA